MLHIKECRDLGDLNEQLRNAPEASEALMSDVVRAACRRFPSLGLGEKTTRVERLIRSGAWTDAALALIDLELPQWQIRRLVYDDGEWYCALSRERELPDWLDQSIEARHADLALAILGAFVEARRISEPESKTSVPAVNRTALNFYEPVGADNYF